ncbi:hypothetical protein NCS57_00642400 [Fusarium keratoplasticum]|uniref:Uncharacterized protein n=1 Tax=Fusarium keratoplasticum TaxID=1328300 RepID=A0ACC0R1E3_9HYPO|nr:hypothetical protein NCS57_00642400 [Fusarium keratoplasticum]KAI8671666.1 hypothetical protein NCS57_00642400 [Fusarium keratoplasticum]
MPRAKKNATTTELVVKPPRKKPGPAPKPLSERVYKPAKPIQRIENSYSQRRKEEVLLYLLNHTIYDPDSWKSVNCYRKPFQRDASKHFKIPEATIHTWWKNRTSILNREKKSRKKKGSKGPPVSEAGETAPPETDTTESEPADPGAESPAADNEGNTGSSEIQDG